MTENKRFAVKPLMFVEEQRNGIFEVGGERLFNNEIVGLLDNLTDENEQLREALKNSYITELCENCKYVIYESWEVPFCGWEHDRDCKKGHTECEVTECDDFELNLKVWLND